MPFFKKNILTLIFLVLIYGAFYISSALFPQQTTLEISGANTNTAVFVQPESGRGPILDAINNAKSEILVQVYILSDKQIIDALKDAKMRGVRVNVMLEEHPFGGGNLNKNTKKNLDSAGVAFRWANSAFPLTHEKAIIIDQTKAFILNQNLTASSFTKNREYGVIDTNFQDVSQVRNIFIGDWERKSFSPAVSHLIVSPTNSRAALTTLINSATKTVDVEVEIIQDKQVAELLSERAKSVEVRIIVPTFSQIQSNAETVREMARNGVLVKTLSSPYIHAKLILIDDQKAYVGSVNLSTQSMDQNREVGIMISENENISIIDSTFESDWDKGEKPN